MWLLLSKIKLQHLLIIAVIGLGAFSIWSLGEIKFQKNEKLRQQQNYENLRDKDSLKVALLSFRTKQELEDYLDSNKELKELLKKQKIKLRKAEHIIYQKQEYINNLNNKMDVSGIVEKIRKDEPAKINWKDSTDCLVVKGNVQYRNDSLAVNVTDRKFDNKIAIVGGWERNEWSFLGIKTRLFGRKKAKVTASSKCGKTETIVIEKQKK